MRHNVFFLLLTAIILCVPLTAGAQLYPPDRLGFQGVLRNTADHTVTGTEDMIFRFYNADTGGTTLWEESYTTVFPPQITTEHGVFVVELGDPVHRTGGLETEFHSVMANTSPVYLGITVGIDLEMSPRIEVTASGFAMNAYTLDGSDASSFALDGHTHVLAGGAIDVTSTPAELNRLSGVGPTVTAANLTALTDGSNADPLHNHNLLASADGVFLRRDMNDTAQGKLTFTGLPAGTGIDQASVFVNPGTADPNDVIWGVSVSSVPAFFVDAEGDARIPYRLTVGNDANAFPGTVVIAKGLFSAPLAEGIHLAIDNTSATGTVTGIRAVAEDPVAANDVIVTGIEGRGVGSGNTDGPRYGVKGHAINPSNGVNYGVYAEASGATGSQLWVPTNYGFYTPDSAGVEENFMTMAGQTWIGDIPSWWLYGIPEAQLMVTEEDYLYFHSDVGDPNLFLRRSYDLLSGGQSTVYAVRSRSTLNSGLSYSLSETNKAVEGYSLLGDTNTFGIVGALNYEYSSPPTSRSVIASGGILGSETNGFYWGSLAYKTLAGPMYGGYFTSYSVGSGFSSANKGIGTGSYGELLLKSGDRGEGIRLLQELQGIRNEDP